MLITCKYCGRIHDKYYDCGRKPARKPARGRQGPVTDESRFRWTKEWKDKRDEIRARDLSLCQCCIRGLYQYGSKRPLNYDGLSVHHAKPLSEAWDLRLDDSNLITLCSYHHEMAETGQIPYAVIKGIIDEQEIKKREKRSETGLIMPL